MKANMLAVILALNGIIWLRRQMHDAAMTFGEQSDLYNGLAKQYKNKYDGKATFYHYSGMKVDNFVVMLFENGYDIRLFVENPDVAHKLECDYQCHCILSAFSQFKRELQICKQKGRNKGRIKIYQCDVPPSVRAALFDDQDLALGWYAYELAAIPPVNFPKDKLAVWGHNGWGMVINNRHPQFGSAREFLNNKYEKWISAHEVWSYP